MRPLTLLAVLALAVATLRLAAAAPRDCATLRTFPVQTMGIHISGGIQGRNDWFVVDLTNGNVCIRKRGSESQGKLTAAELAHLKSAVESSGFFKWNAEYLPKARVPDGMSTRIVFDDGKRRHSVVWADPVAPPAGFQALARRFEMLGYAPYWHSTTWLYVTGRLEHSDLEGGFWTVIYATGAEASKDKYGGKLVLEIDKSLLSGFKSGDLVLLTGALDPERVGIQMAGPHYRVKKIEHLR